MTKQPTIISVIIDGLSIGAGLLLVAWGIAGLYLLLGVS
jgi:branched-subunit amino acid ABC-type transport system permease component